MKRTLAVSFVALLSAWLWLTSPLGALAVQGVLPAGRTVWSGAYTPEQARRGQAGFEEKCASCHGANLEGTQGSAVEVDGAALVGAEFFEKWREDDLGELFSYIQSGMPREAADTVADSVKIDILAFILQKNGFPPGAAELTAAAAPGIMLVGKDGPQPLPGMTAVRAVGCLQQASPGMWILSNAPEPVRTRNPAETSPQELQDSAVRPSGSLSFKLPRLASAVPGVKPSAWEGHRVQVKGVVYRQAGNDRINVTAIASVAATCPQ